METLLRLVMFMTFSYVLPVEGEKILNLTLLKNGVWSSSVQDITTGEDISRSFSVTLTNERDPFVWTMQVADNLPLNLRTELHDLMFTIHCTVHSISTLFIRRAILLPQPTNDESIHSLIEITVSKSTKAQAIAAELYQVLNVSDTILSLIVPTEGRINEVESLYLELTKNGVLTFKRSLSSSSEDSFLYILRRVFSSSTELLPVLVYLRPDDASHHLNANDTCYHQPVFKLHNCTSQHCDIDVYKIEIQSTFQGEITDLKPSNIYAEDYEGRQTSYFFLTGNPRNYNTIFSIDPETGIVNTTGINLTNSHQAFYMVIKAEVKSSPECFEKVLLNIKVTNNIYIPSTRFTTKHITRVKLLTKQSMNSMTATDVFSNSDLSYNNSLKALHTKSVSRYNNMKKLKEGTKQHVPFVQPINVSSISSLADHRSPTVFMYTFILAASFTFD